MPASHSVSRYPKLRTTGEGWTVGRLFQINRLLTTTDRDSGCITTVDVMLHLPFTRKLDPEMTEVLLLGQQLVPHPDRTSHPPSRGRVPGPGGAAPVHVGGHRLRKPKEPHHHSDMI